MHIDNYDIKKNSPTKFWIRNFDIISFWWGHKNTIPYEFSENLTICRPLLPMVIVLSFVQFPSLIFSSERRGKRRVESEINCDSANSIVHGSACSAFQLDFCAILERCWHPRTSRVPRSIRRCRILGNQRLVGAVQHRRLFYPFGQWTPHTVCLCGSGLFWWGPVWRVATYPSGGSRAVGVMGSLGGSSKVLLGPVIP